MAVRKTYHLISYHLMYKSTSLLSLAGRNPLADDMYVLFHIPSLMTYCTKCFRHDTVTCSSPQKAHGVHHHPRQRPSTSCLASHLCPRQSKRQPWRETGGERGSLPLPTTPTERHLSQGDPGGFFFLSFFLHLCRRCFFSPFTTPTNPPTAASPQTPHHPTFPRKACATLFFYPRACPGCPRL